MGLFEKIKNALFEEEYVEIEDLTIQEIDARVQEVFKDAEYTNLMAIPGTGIH